MEFDFYYGSQADQFSFIRIPRQLLLNPAFSGLSIHAKMLYAVLLDRMSLSLKNHWLDSQNRVYIIYQVEEITQDLGYTKRKALDVLTELEAFGLVTRKRRGRGLPNYLYVKNFVSGLAEAEKAKIISFSGNEGACNSEASRDGSRRIASCISAAAGSDARRYEIRTSGTSDADARRYESCTSEQTETGAGMPASRLSGCGRESSRASSDCVSGHLLSVPEVQKPYLQEVSNPALQEGADPALLEGADSAPLMSYTEKNDIYRNQTEENNADIHQSIVSIRRDVMDQIGYDILSETYGRDEIEGIADLITETLTTKKQKLVIGGESISSGVVKERFQRLDMFHVEYVLDCMRETTTKIRNIRQYLLTALYNAPATMPHYYAAEVNHNMYGTATGNKSRV